ncbi:MFS transporter [Andreprevotia chitinilytica]|uniref:MFS transporter n=1 Tax=Andreprevotia chitinilytica TaxID=396808 RepID=UPI000A81D4DF|nr:MFS transporter [Andreprevotia chitinilytica]
MQSVNRTELDRVIGKITRRLIPFLLLMYVLAFLDRANIGFAKKAFQLDTGISDAAFAFGAGIFFAGYALLEVPSNLIMHRVGARVWLCRIMVTWGMISAAMMFAHDETTFYVLRFLLGVAEAGFFPGVIWYLTLWFPSAYRGRALGMFYFGAPLAFIFGSPLSGLLLEFHGAAGLHGWQWMFLIEGLLASAVGIWALFYLDNTPARATWLCIDEKAVLDQAMTADDRQRGSDAPHSMRTLLANGRVLYLSLIYALIQMSVYGVVFYLPSQIAALMGQQIGFKVGLVAAIPWVCALAAAYLIPRYSDRTGERRVPAALTLAAAGAGIALSATFANSVLSLLALCLAASGFIAVQPLFWTFPTDYLRGVAAAGGLALINSLGAVGSFIAPNAKTWAERTFESSQAGLYLLAATSLIGALLIYLIRLKAPPLLRTTQAIHP